ncbi:MAG TPA: hypothetical protein DEQ61_06215, partial [Streptomyces sp.]|nr:hypothetical protein [Streptomyces sp.]
MRDETDETPGTARTNESARTAGTAGSHRIDETRERHARHRPRPTGTAHGSGRNGRSRRDSELGAIDEAAVRRLIGSDAL